MNKQHNNRQHALRELCELFAAADEWGRDRILEAARRQVPAAKTLPAPTLTLITAGPVLDQHSHRLDNSVNLRPLSLVSQSIYAK